jgi:hypothetical protein
MDIEMANADVRKAWQRFTSQAQPPEWVRRMIEHYRQTGTYRPEDLRRLLGDPTRGVEVGPNPSLASFLGTAEEN